MGNPNVRRKVAAVVKERSGIGRVAVGVRIDERVVDPTCLDRTAGQPAEQRLVASQWDG